MTRRAAIGDDGRETAFQGFGDHHAIALVVRCQGEQIGAAPCGLQRLAHQFAGKGDVMRDVEFLDQRHQPMGMRHVAVR